MRLGIDLGGTKIEGVALSAANDVVARLRVPTPLLACDAAGVASQATSAAFDCDCGCCSKTRKRKKSASVSSCHRT